MEMLYFTKDHEWLRIDGDVATVGVTNHAQEQLGDLVFVDLPQVEQALKQGEAVAVVESVKAASDVYAPIDGIVLEVNEALTTDAALVNQQAETEGWLWKMRVTDVSQLETLLDAGAYQAFIG
ncbi:glycine cleavage system protein GcvH [Bartonella sp. DGB2]|uniref:glycine cleavage system protein GcvH n=1 Tax=Bartonella sp. DGB2 TaxID=3388426 RepID=UPI00398FC94D